MRSILIAFALVGIVCVYFFAIFATGALDRLNTHSSSLFVASAASTAHQSSPPRTKLNNGPLSRHNSVFNAIQTHSSGSIAEAGIARSLLDASVARTPSSPPAQPASPPPPFDSRAFMYTEAGQQHLSADRLDAAHLAPLTRETQRFIWRHQHPTTCADKTFVISAGNPNAGTGSVLHVAGYHLAYALERGYIFLWCVH